MEYRIFEGNMERLEKKLTRIANKCKKYGNAFTYEKIREEFEEYTDTKGNKYTVKYIVINAEGTAIINNWKFIASVQHTDKGNIFKNCCDVEVPARYYTSDSFCEHCNSKRYRKSTYIVQNTETGEFKQVGKSCLKDFTCGMSAEGIAHYISLFDELIEGQHIEEGFHPTRYIRTVEAMQYIAETIKHFSYVKSDDERPTKQRAKEYYQTDYGMVKNSKIKKELQKEMEKVSFNAHSDYAKKLVQDILMWIEKHEESNNYFHNLKTVCSLEYITFENFGLLTSAFPAYDKDKESEKRETEEKAKEKKSEYMGNVGDRITVWISEFKVVTSWETMYGVTKIFKIIDVYGNVYIWKTNGEIAEGTKEIFGTVKAHNEYNGIKQTELTRCKAKSK